MSVSDGSGERSTPPSFNHRSKSDSNNPLVASARRRRASAVAVAAATRAQPLGIEPFTRSDRSELTSSASSCCPRPHSRIAVVNASRASEMSARALTRIRSLSNSTRTCEYPSRTECSTTSAVHASKRAHHAFHASVSMRNASHSRCARSRVPRSSTPLRCHN